MGSEFWGPLTAVGGTVALFGGIALLMWVDYRGKAREKEMAHTERLKALETGQSLPDAYVAQARAEASRAWAAALTTVFVALGMAGTALGATALVFRHADRAIHLPLISVVWGISGVVGLVAVCIGLGAVRQRERTRVRETHPNTDTRHRSAEVIQTTDAPGLPVSR